MELKGCGSPPTGRSSAAFLLFTGVQIMIVTDKRIAANRANAAKSTGPKTPEGKAHSSQNALKHGVLASIVTLRNEDPVAFDEAVDTYLARFKPQDDVERDMIYQMVAATWRIRRSLDVENHMLDIEMENHATIPTAIGRITAAYKALAPTKEMGLICRYQFRLYNQHSRLMRDLNVLRRDFPLDAPSPAADPAPEPQPPAEKIPPNEPTKSLAINKPAPTNEPIEPTEPTTDPAEDTYVFPTCDPWPPEDLE
jgi:hypothetical protein